MWDVGAFQNQTAHIEIVDEQKGGWGHINVDQIEFSDLPGNRAVMLAAGRVAAGAFQRRCRPRPGPPGDPKPVQFENLELQAGASQVYHRQWPEPAHPAAGQGQGGAGGGRGAGSGRRRAPARRVRPPTRCSAAWSARITPPPAGPAPEGARVRHAGPGGAGRQTRPSCPRSRIGRRPGQRLPRKAASPPPDQAGQPAHAARPHRQRRGGRHGHRAGRRHRRSALPAGLALSQQVQRSARPGWAATTPRNGPTPGPSCARPPPTSQRMARAGPSCSARPSTTARCPTGCWIASPPTPPSSATSAWSSASPTATSMAGKARTAAASRPARTSGATSRRWRGSFPDLERDMRRIDFKHQQRAGRRRQQPHRRALAAAAHRRAAVRRRPRELHPQGLPRGAEPAGRRVPQGILAAHQARGRIPDRARREDRRRPARPASCRTTSGTPTTRPCTA